MSVRIGLNLGLAIVWCLLSGTFTGWNLLAGLLIGLVIISLYSHSGNGPAYAMRLVNLVRFGFWFTALLIRSNIQIAREIVTPGWSQTPRILRYDVHGLTDVQAAVLSSSITLTPGTLAVDISDDGRFLYLHCMYAKDRERQIHDIDVLRAKLERWVFAQ